MILLLLRLIFSPWRNEANSLTLLALIVTSFQKVFFLTNIFVKLYYGPLLDTLGYYITPDTSDQEWINFLNPFVKEVPAECSSVSIYIKPNCIRSVLVQEDEDLARAALEMSPATKCVYLLLTRTSKILAPVTIQLSIPIFMYLLYRLISTIRENLEQAGPNDRMWKIILYNMRAKRFNYILLLPSYLLMCTAACLIACNPETGCNQTCQSVICLYCYTGFKNTIFVEEVFSNKWYRNIFGTPSSGLLLQSLRSTTTALATTLLLTYIYTITIVIFSFVMFIFIDAANSLRWTVLALFQCLPSPKPKKTITYCYEIYGKRMKELSWAWNNKLNLLMPSKPRVS